MSSSPGRARHTPGVKGRPAGLRSGAQMQIVADERSGELDDLGSELHGVAGEEVHGRVLVDAMVEPDGIEDELADRYGVPMKVSAALHPVP